MNFESRAFPEGFDPAELARLACRSSCAFSLLQLQSHIRRILIQGRHTTPISIQNRLRPPVHKSPTQSLMAITRLRWNNCIFSHFTTIRISFSLRPYVMILDSNVFHVSLLFFWFDSNASFTYVHNLNTNVSNNQISVLIQNTDYQIILLLDNRPKKIF